MREKEADISLLSGQDITAGGTTLYSPQYVFDSAYRTTLSVINLDSVPGVVTFRLVQENGIQLGATRVVAIPPNGKVLVDDPAFFQPTGPQAVTGGYIEVVSDGVRLAGSTVFSGANGQSFSCALAFISKLADSVLFSHAVSDETYFTGLAILNPNTADAIVAIELRAADGSVIDRKQHVIAAGHREARLLTQYFPSLEGKNQSSGYIRLISDQPIASFALFGTHSLSAISAIPQQAIR